MVRFTEHFGIPLTQHSVDFVNVNLDSDIPLFIDPVALAEREDEWAQVCTGMVAGFFQRIVDLIRSGDEATALKLLDGLSEPNDTRLGLSKGAPKGRGVSGRQARYVYGALVRSNAVRSGLVSDISDCDLFIEGIGRDKISDMTTNIIRGQLIEYTQQQCVLHDIPMTDDVVSGRIWLPDKGKWQTNKYVNLPTYNGERIILVPKHIVKWSPSFDSQKFYDGFAIQFLKEEELANNGPLVHTFKNGRVDVFKTTLKEKHPFDKDWLAGFSEKHPQVLNEYRKYMKGLGQIVDRIEEITPQSTASIKASFKQTLASIPKGKKHYRQYEKVIAAIFEFIFWPHLCLPRMETRFDGGIKRVDLTFMNGSKSGFFNALRASANYRSSMVFVECKNYTEEIQNPEIDQLANRFTHDRGRFGFIAFRETADWPRLLARCKSTSRGGNGLILPINDARLISLIDAFDPNNDTAVNNLLFAWQREILT
ncbi:MAG: hypothetical protein DI628_01875 [Blastochloris viridis]|uniref:Uncharacterized protein n=1 Tax=Blastochloris viridis TaxID=1079 RepID=A0A6N4RDM4_BLAVI|nr:MAG: hypothetical protein DI628_01875 [Blastochloris viridis]